MKIRKSTKSEVNNEQFQDLLEYNKFLSTKWGLLEKPTGKVKEFATEGGPSTPKVFGVVEEAPGVPPHSDLACPGRKCSLAGSFPKRGSCWCKAVPPSCNAWTSGQCEEVLLVQRLPCKGEQRLLPAPAIHHLAWLTVGRGGVEGPGVALQGLCLRQPARSTLWAYQPWSYVLFASRTISSSSSPWLASFSPHVFSSSVDAFAGCHDRWFI